MQRQAMDHAMGPTGLRASRLRTLVLAVFVAAASWTRVSCHEGHDNSAPHCDSDAAELEAYYVPGELTVDGDASDWSGVAGGQYQMLQAINPSPEEHYPPGSGTVTVKAAHDGQNIYLVMQVPGTYTYSTTDGHLAPAVALMFGVGDDATFYNMGGCAHPVGSCNASNCAGHEVDLVEFKINTAIPGRQYGANLADNLQGLGKDSIGQLDDMYAWNPHCRNYDGPRLVPGPMAAASTPVGSQNDWRGAWSHSSIDNQFGLVASDAPFGKAGDAGEYVFEFTRPLRTTDRAQQDVQMAIGPLRALRFGAALWYPATNATPWVPHQHYVLSCDWIELELLPASQPGNAYFSAAMQGGGGTGNTAVSGVALLVAILALAVSVVAGWWVKANSRQFTPMEISM